MIAMEDLVKTPDNDTFRDTVKRGFVEIAKMT
jgi:hypothetical protein